jgi:hypothetical protein
LAYEYRPGQKMYDIVFKRDRDVIFHVCAHANDEAHAVEVGRDIFLSMSERGLVTGDLEGAIAEVSLAKLQRP